MMAGIDDEHDGIIISKTCARVAPLHDAAVEMIVPHAAVIEGHAIFSFLGSCYRATLSAYEDKMK